MGTAASHRRTGPGSTFSSRWSGDDGYSQSFRFKRVDLDQETDRQGSPFNTILGACESTGDAHECVRLSAYRRHSEARASK